MILFGCKSLQKLTLNNIFLSLIYLAYLVQNPSRRRDVFPNSQVKDWLGKSCPVEKENSEHSRQGGRHGHIKILESRRGQNNSLLETRQRHILESMLLNNKFCSSY